MAYDVYNNDTGARLYINISATEAADVVQMDEGEMLWCIEEHDQCETDTHTVTTHTLKPRVSNV